MKKHLKSILIFVSVVVALGVSGTWLHNGGWLEMPRIFDVPAILGGSSEASAQSISPSDAAPRETHAQRGERHGGSSGLNWDMFPGVLANLWIIALIIAVGVYSARLFRLSFQHLTLH